MTALTSVPVLKRNGAVVCALRVVPIQAAAFRPVAVPIGTLRHSHHEEHMPHVAG